MFWSKITEGFLICFDIQKTFNFMFWGLLSRLHVFFKQLVEIKVTPLVLTAAVLTLDPEGIWTIWFLHHNFYYHSFPRTTSLCGRA